MNNNPRVSEFIIYDKFNGPKMHQLRTNLSIQSDPKFKNRWIILLLRNRNQSVISHNNLL